MKNLFISLVLIALVFIGTTMLVKVLPDHSKEAGLDQKIYVEERMIQAQEER